MSMKKAFAAALKQARKDLGMNMKEFSEELGIALSSLEEYEAARRMPRTDTVEQIANKLHRSPISLISDLPCGDQQLHCCFDYLSCKIRRLHPAARNSARNALDQLFLTFQISDKYFLLETAQPEKRGARYRYLLYEPAYFLSGAPVYGILAEELRDNVRAPSALITPFSSDRIAVLHIVSSANEMQLPPGEFFSDVFPNFFPPAT